jgi:hypothetical protein
MVPTGQDISFAEYCPNLGKVGRICQEQNELPHFA